MLLSSQLIRMEHSRLTINRFNIHRSLCVSCACRSVGICVLASLLIAARETQAESFASQFSASEDITVELYADESQVADPRIPAPDGQQKWRKISTG